jgi:hypothetical protein
MQQAMMPLATNLSACGLKSKQVDTGISCLLLSVPAWEWLLSLMLAVNV